MSTAPDSSSSGLRGDRVLEQRHDEPRHEAMPYSSPRELAGRLTGPVRAAVAAGDLVTAVLEDEAGRRLRAELGGTADGVEFLRPDAVHAVPGFTTAVRWAGNIGRVTRPGGRALIVGQQLVDLPGCGPEYWMRLCIGLEVAGAGLPLTVLCPFHDDPAGWDRVRATHPVLGPDGTGPNPDYRPPREVLRTLTPLPRPELGPPTAELTFRATDLGQLRHLTTRIAGRGGLGPDRISDAVLAVNELATNSVEHGPGAGRLRLWTDGRVGLLAEVADGGRLTDVFPGMVRPATSGSRGRGLWLASELSDVMEVWTDGGTVVRVSWDG
jgi:anti-sigma regulatory factor (Ser/Thr protein kinase)